MPFQHTIEQTWKSGGYEIRNSVNVTGDREGNISTVIPAGATDHPLDITLKRSRARSLYISANESVTLRPPQAKDKDKPLTITPQQPLVWTADSGFPFPFAADVNGLMAANAGEQPAQLEIRSLQDS